MTHFILTYLVNFIIYTAVLFIWIAIVCAVFKIKPNYAWVNSFFEKILKPFFIKVWQLFIYLSKVFLKWLLFTLEQFWYFLVEISRKFVDLIYDVDS